MWFYFFLFPADSSSYCIVWGPLNYKYTFMYKMAQNPKREASLKRKSYIFFMTYIFFLSLLITSTTAAASRGPYVHRFVFMCRCPLLFLCDVHCCFSFRCSGTISSRAVMECVLDEQPPVFRTNASC